MQTGNTIFIIVAFLLINQLNLIRTSSGTEIGSLKNSIDISNQKYNIILVEILQNLQANSLVGQILLPGESLSDSLDVATFGELGIPWVVFDNQNHSSLSTQVRRKQIQLNRFSSSYYAHIDVDVNEYQGKYWKSWRRLYSGLLHHHSDKRNGDPIRSFTERIFLKDFFILHENVKADSNNIDSRSISQSSFTIPPKNSIWIMQHILRSKESTGMNYGLQEKCEYGSSVLEFSPGKNSAFSEFYGNNVIQGQGQGQNAKKEAELINSCGSNLGNAEISLACPGCLPKELVYLKNKETCDGLRRFNRERSFIGCLLSEVVEKLNTTFKISLKSSGSPDMYLHTRNENSIVKRSQGYGMASRMIFRSSLIFIAKRRVQNWDSILRPFTLVSWIGIFAAYSTAAVVFAIIKIVTLNNPDQSWYDYMVQQLLEIVNDERNIKRNITEIKSDVENGNVDFSSAKEDANSGDIENERGKTSKAVLNATIRMVSFVLVAAYEGKLYNTITFPKSRFVSTFDELMAGDKYSVKVSREAEQADLIYNLRSQSTNHSRIIRNASSVIMESVNIEDCINWVESSTNHACIGYDFEFRNLQKGQQFEKIIAKSKEKASSSFRFGFNSGRGTRKAFPALQISRWVLESGIFQFWTAAENIFSEAVVPNRFNKSRVLTIKDYLGLFLVYTVLLILASLSFCFESFYYRVVKRKMGYQFIFGWWHGAKSFCSKSIGKIKGSFVKAKAFFLQVKNKLTKRRKTKIIRLKIAERIFY